ncbi:unnamed protein product [[Candida] boidinii]|nr:unnamed protein product [[Candida] boidinii]
MGKLSLFSQFLLAALFVQDSFQYMARRDDAVAYTIANPYVNSSIASIDSSAVYTSKYIESSSEINESSSVASITSFTSPAISSDSESSSAEITSISAPVFTASIQSYPAFAVSVPPTWYGVRIEGIAGDGIEWDSDYFALEYDHSTIAAANYDLEINAATFHAGYSGEFAGIATLKAGASTLFSSSHYSGTLVIIATTHDVENKRRLLRKRDGVVTQTVVVTASVAPEVSTTPASSAIEGSSSVEPASSAVSSIAPSKYISAYIN